MLASRSRNASASSAVKPKVMYCTALILSSLLRPSSNRARRVWASPIFRKTRSSMPRNFSSASRRLVWSSISRKRVALKFPGRRDQLVVDVDLLADLVQVTDALGPQHLLYLEDHRGPVLEHQRDLVPHRYPPVLLEIDDLAAERVALLLVGAGADDVVQRDLFHCAKETVRKRPSFAAPTPRAVSARVRGGKRPGQRTGAINRRPRGPCRRRPAGPC